MSRYQQQTDAELMMSLRQGHSYAFTEIYNRYWKKLLAIAYNHSRNKVIAEEIVQEVFISLWHRREVLNVEALNAYLATAVRLSVFKQYQRQKRKDEIAEQAAGSVITTWDEEMVYAKFLQQYIDGIVEELPEKCRMVFKLSRKEGLSIPEIAEKMGIAEKTVESHLTKALKVLKLKLNHTGLWVIILTKILVK
jgi:RNA polymerase sigma-70 factor (ECF subfamily)